MLDLLCLSPLLGGEADGCEPPPWPLGEGEAGRCVVTSAENQNNIPRKL